MSWLRSLLFSVGMIATLVSHGVLVILCAPAPLRIRLAIASHWPYIVLRWLRFTCGIDFRITGVEYLRLPGVVVLSKHQSTWETLALQWLIPRPVWVAKRELLRVPVFGQGLYLAGAIIIDRAAGKSAVEQIVEQGRARLKAGASVVIFPEGTRVPPGERRRYRMGGAILAVETGAPVVPVAHDAGYFWSRRAFLKVPGTVQLVVGEPIPSVGKTAGQLITEVERWIEAKVLELGPPRLRGRAAD